MTYEDLLPPPWLMTVSQAREIVCLSRKKGMTVSEAVDKVLEGLGEEREVVRLRDMLMTQLEWILSGKSPFHSPYYESFMETYDYPFGRHSAHGHQIDIALDEFINLLREMVRG